MSATAIIDVVKHYQKSIEKSQNDELRLLHCIDKLYRLPVTVEHLQETGVGKTVNSLRKFNGEVGVAAKALVTKWKAMVSAEDQPAEPTNNNSHRKSTDEEKSDAEDNGNNHNAYMLELEHHKIKSSSEYSDVQNTNNSKEIHHSKDSRKNLQSKHHRSNDNYKQDKLKSEKIQPSLVDFNFMEAETIDDDEEKLIIDVNKSEKMEINLEKREHRESHRSLRDEKKQSTSDKLKKSSGDSNGHKSHSENSMSTHSRNETHKSRKSKHSKDKDRSKHKSSSRDKEKGKSDKDSKSDRKETNKSHSSSDSSAKQQKRKRSHSETKSDESPNKSAKVLVSEIDNSMGASFEDVLGMCNMPSTSKSSKSPNFKSPKVIKSTPSSSSIDNGQASYLLSSRVKLKPLDPSIALELPTISTNYKPMPLNPTVMDCVFSSSNQRPRGLLTDEEAYSHGISSKTMRTKVYSGVKTGALFKVTSLFDLCIRLLQKNIDALEYTGGIPFEVLKPVLERATPQQLITFEEYNAYIMEDTDFLWEQHIKRHYRGKERQEYETWREMYIRCKEEQEQKLSILAEKVKISQTKTALPVRKTQLAYVDSMVKPPRSVLRKQEQFGTKQKLIATPASRVAALSSITPNAAKSGDNRLRIAAGVRDSAQATAACRPRKAPLMQKTLQSIKARFKR